MKTYIINSNCIYNEGKYELRTVSNSQVIKMTAMRAKCLSFIIENAHLEIIRATKNNHCVMGSRSHYVNDANPTQILYLIRRDLKALGINDLLLPFQDKASKLIVISPLSRRIAKQREEKNRLYGKPSPP